MTALFKVYEIDPKAVTVTQHEPFWAGGAETEGPNPEVVASASLGWHRGAGYELFKTIDDNAAYAILIPHELATNAYCSPFFNPDGGVNRDAVEAYVTSALYLSDRVLTKREEVFEDFLHRITYLAGMLVHNTAVPRGQQNNKEYLISRLRNLSALSVALDAETKLHLFSYGGPLSEINIDIRDVVYKISRLFDHFCGRLAKRAKLMFEGESNDCITRGPDIFEVVPYKIMENAVKYAINNTTVTMRVWRANRNIFCEFESWGPELKSGEHIEIFKRGYRGEWARALPIGGLGVGLSQVKAILEQCFESRIVVEQRTAGPAVVAGGVPHRETTFRVVVPVRD